MPIRRSMVSQRPSQMVAVAAVPHPIRARTIHQRCGCVASAGKKKERTTPAVTLAMKPRRTSVKRTSSPHLDDPRAARRWSPWLRSWTGPAQRMQEGRFWGRRHYPANPRQRSCLTSPCPWLRPLLPGEDTPHGSRPVCDPRPSAHARPLHGNRAVSPVPCPRSSQIAWPPEGSEKAAGGFPLTAASSSHVSGRWGGAGEVGGGSGQGSAGLAPAFCPLRAPFARRFVSKQSHTTDHRQWHSLPHCPPALAGLGYLGANRASRWSTNLPRPLPTLLLSSRGADSLAESSSIAES